MTASYIYFIRTEDSRFVKIGVADNVADRLKDLQCASAVRLLLMTSIEFASRADAFRGERQLHEYFKSARARGEWFRLNNDVRRMVLATKRDRTNAGRASAVVYKFLQDLKDLPPVEQSNAPWLAKRRAA